MAYPESHEPYNDSQDAYTTQPIHYTGYGYQYPPVTPPNGGYPAYTQTTFYGQPTAPYVQQQQMAQQAQIPAKKPQTKVMKRTKAESLALVSKLKKWIIAASVVSFGALSFLVAGNVVGVTSHTR